MRKESDAETFNCIICKEDRQHYSIGVCDHRKVCNYCSLRSRTLYKDKKCPICTTKLDYVFIFENIEKPSYSEMEKNKDYYYQDDEFEDNGIYYSTVSAKEEALQLKSFLCPIKSCQDGAFDNLQTLCTHLNKVHKRYYCEVCLKEGKKFLSEMPIYTYEGLNEHITYGEYSEKGNLIIPPHPVCSFCNIKFYNDEHLFKHMNEQHFICQLCRDKKNIIFYKEISQLLDHYQSMHYVCPYQECLEDMFVVFDTEEKLNSHLMTKHKCVDAQHRITSFHVEKKKSDAKFNKTCFIKGEFNFTQYVNELKDRVKEYIKNFGQRTHFLKEEPVDEQYHRASNNSNIYNENIQYQQRGGRGKKNAGRSDQYNELYDLSNQQDSIGNHYQDEIYNQQSYNSKQNKRGGKKGRGGRHENMYEYNENYGYGEYNQYDNYNNDQNYGQGQIYGQAYTSNQYDNKFNQNKRPTNDNQHQFQSKKQSNRGKHQNGQENKFKESQNTNKYADVNRPPVKIDYSFIFNSFAKIVKEYVVTKIKKDNPPEEEFVIPRETIYQLIIIVDRLENEKMRELTSITNFGIDLEVFRELKTLISEAIFDQNSINKVLDKLEIKKLLILYKYLITSAKKVDGLFYKLELEQIETDLYDDFATRKYPKKPQQSAYQNNLPMKENRPTKIKPKVIDGKFKMNEQNFPSLIGNKPDTKERKDNSQKLKNIFDKKEEIRQPTGPAIIGTRPQTGFTSQSSQISSQQIQQKTSQILQQTQQKTLSNTSQPTFDNLIDINLSQNKLTLFFDNKIQAPKKEAKQKKNFNKNKLDYDDEFPEL